MSTDLYWIKPDPKKQPLPDELKMALRKRYGNPVQVTLTKNSIPYLHGLQDAGVHVPIAIFNAIQAYEEILLGEE